MISQQAPICRSFPDQNRLVKSCQSLLSLLHNEWLSAHSASMQLIASPATLRNVFLAHLEACERVSFAVAWASTGFDQYEALRTAQDKIDTAIIGTHFYQTDPAFIEAFATHSNVRFVRETSGVFHPKIFLFEGKGGNWTCLIGSANLTRGGFIKNHEACLLLTSADDAGGSILAETRATIESYWQIGVPGSTIDIDGYTKLARRFAKKLNQAAGVFGSRATGRPLDEVDILTMSWKAFQDQVNDDPVHEIGKRLKVLEAARAIFRKYPSFAAIPLQKRQGLGGYLGEHDVSWGYFGSMRSAGVFKNLVNEAPNGISDALDKIPLDRAVTRDDFLAFAERYLKAFPFEDGKHKRHGLGTATRLLAMKRPDYFFCLDRPNKRRLFDAFGVTISTQDYEGYWDQVIERIQLSEWWNAPAPASGTARAVWDGRAAMLDAILYDPDV